MERNPIRIVLTGLVGIGLMVFCAPATRAQGAGATLFKTKCAVCHGPDGTGSPTGKKLGARNLASAEVQSQSDAQLTDVITKGKNKMPAYDGKLKPDEFTALVAYVRELAKK
ncbi:MAG: cytochrome c [Acidobacteriota bacterium]|nr:cytochrome c [Acidobacteriota bacterium]